MSEKNINAILDRINAEHAARPVPKPSKTECTGCGVGFAESDFDEEDEDEEEKTYADEVCDDCGTIRYDLTVVDLA
jgi:ribosomal protein L12E/L44/L45/RPP1/RPP2